MPILGVEVTLLAGNGCVKSVKIVKCVLLIHFSVQQGEWFLGKVAA